VKRTLIRIALVAFGMFCLYALLPAQTVTVTASNLQDGASPANGTIYWKPAVQGGVSASYRKPGGGIATVTPVSAAVSNGAFSLTLPDTTLTTPQNICFSVSLNTSNGSVLGAGYSCVQPHGTAVGSNDWCQAGVCNFDNYTPSLPVQPIFYGSPDMMTMWNTLVSANIAAGNTLTPVTLTDASTVTFNATNATLNAATLPLYNSTATPPTSDGITARTINMTGLVTGARFLIVINPMGAAAGTQTQTVNFGSGCVWQFAPGVNVSGNVLSIPPWANWSYLAAFVYDGTNCIGTVVD
jgi:hypothetical protein